jgi:hypothetical protein
MSEESLVRFRLLIPFDQVLYYLGLQKPPTPIYSPTWNHAASGKPADRCPMDF